MTPGLPTGRKATVAVVSLELVCAVRCGLGGLLQLVPEAEGL